MKKSWKFLPHEGEAYIECWGNTLEEVHENAAKAFYDVMCDVEKIEAKLEREIEVTGEDWMEAFFNFINELIFLFETEGLVFSDFKVKISKNKEWRIYAKMRGERYSLEKHNWKVGIKAISFHGMELTKQGDRWIIRYLLDI